MEHHPRKTNAAVSQQIRSLRFELGLEFGVASRLISAFLGPVVEWTSRREEKRLARGVIYEPKVIIERRNWSAI